jgi:hypothetical protein
MNLPQTPTGSTPVGVFVCAGALKTLVESQKAADSGGISLPDPTAQILIKTNIYISTYAS